MAAEQQTRNSALTFGTTAVQVSPELILGTRIAFVATNTSTAGQIVTLSWGDDAVSLRGIVLYPAGGTHSESIDSAFIPNNQRISAISDAAGATLAVHERTVRNI